jgi:hypothetical protein
MSFRKPPGESLFQMRTKLFLEYLTQPLHITALASMVYLFGSFRTKVAFDLVRRRQHAYSILDCANRALIRNLNRLTIIECGVGSGAGLLNMCDIGRRVTALTGVEFEVVGFDTGTGLPPPRDYRDHPEIFQAGDFPMTDSAELKRQLPANAQLILGDLKDTAALFLNTLKAEAPIAYVAVDVDYYSSTKEAMQIFLGEADRYLPCTIVYFDDVSFWSANSWCGERLAIREFNEANTFRKLEHDRFLKYRRVYKDSDWLDRIYELHVLDHPERQGLKVLPRARYDL